MTKIYGIWEKFQTLPMGFLLSVYENSNGEVFSSVLGGKIYEGVRSEKVYVPAFSEEFARKLLEIRGMANIVESIDVKPENKAGDFGLQKIVKFHERDEVEELTRKRYFFWHHSKCRIGFSSV